MSRAARMRARRTRTRADDRRAILIGIAATAALAIALVLAAWLLVMRWEEVLAYAVPA